MNYRRVNDQNSSAAKAKTTFKNQWGIRQKKKNWGFSHINCEECAEKIVYSRAK